MNFEGDKTACGAMTPPALLATSPEDWGGKS
jgi:hypothetical protein